jgi:hypothetical protein
VHRDRAGAGAIRGGRRKNDVIDAAAAASVAALTGDATPILVEDLSTVLALLDERIRPLDKHRNHGFARGWGSGHLAPLNDGVSIHDFTFNWRHVVDG